MIVYRHRRLDTNDIFYIGIGKDYKRAINKNKRSSWWKKINNITEIKVEIIQNDLSTEDAKELEMFLIKEYGRRDLGLGNLVNMTDGGDGSVGFKHSEESKNKISKISKEQYKNGRIVNFKGNKHTDEWKKNFSENHPKPFLGIKRPEHSKKISGELNYNSNIILNLETGIFYYGINEASKSTDNLSFSLLKDNLSKNRKTNHTSFIKTYEIKKI